MNHKTILQHIKEIDPYLREIRGYLHENPEESLQEYKTSKFLQKEISKLGLPVTPVSNTGFFAVLDTGRTGKTLALRTDMDALPVTENLFNLKQKKKWVSQNEGVSHVCGHDAHMAILLGAIQIFYNIRNELNGKIIFIFEDAEEMSGGIDCMIEKLADFHIDAFYGNHIYSTLPTGNICMDSGAIMAGMAYIEFDVTGRGGHGSRPDLSINPIFAAAHILTGISVAWNNQLDVTKTVTLGITRIHGGETNNVFPNSVFIGGSLRFFDRKEAEKAIGVLKKVAENTAMAHNCTVSFRKTGIVLDPVINDYTLSGIAREAVREIFPGKLVEGAKWFASESFSKYTAVAPSVFALIGTNNTVLGSGAEHHNDRFDIDEDALPYALGAMVGFAVKLLHNKITSYG
ncbi:MAG: amidohydrolase [Tannerellaceae bacterium]|jgi:amidohydrolase|nr:amidohydrolase [Tannerellaceae bacterium]